MHGPNRLHVNIHACGRTCAEFRSYMRRANATWAQIESELGVQEWPCAGVIDVMLLREPWTRYAHLISPRFNGDEADASAARGQACASFLPHLDGSDNLVAGRFDNVYTRMLLGLTHDHGCPVGCVNASHLAAARHMLAKFVIMPNTAMLDGMKRLVQRTTKGALSGPTAGTATASADGAASTALRLQLPAEGSRLHAHRSAESQHYGSRSGTASQFDRRWAAWDRVPACVELQQRLERINWADTALYAYALETYIQESDD